MNIEIMMTEAFARDNQTLRARLAAVEQLARDLLARLSRDYGDDEGETDSEINSLFERGEQLLPIIPTQALEDSMRTFDDAVEADTDNDLFEAEFGDLHAM